MILQTPSPIPPVPQIPVDPNLMFNENLPAVVMIVIASLLAVTIILWPIVRALARRIEHKGGSDPVLRAEVEHLQQRLGEVEVLQGRVAELEERVDFAERLLAQPREQDQLHR
jgi:Tfp pilus assembly protein PilO